MQILKRWLHNRRAIKLARENAARLVAEQEREDRKQKLTQETKDIGLALAELGITCTTRYATNNEYTQTTMYGKVDGKIMKVIVFPMGGFRIEEL